MSVRIGTFRKTSLAFLVLSVLVALCLAVTPARAQDLVAQTGDLFVANQTINTIREFSPTGHDLGNFATTGLNTPAGLVFDKDNNLYVSNRGDGTIRTFSRSGTDLGYFATTGIITPVGLAFGPEPEDQDGDT